MIEQGTPEWHALRAGKVTASRISDMLARTKTGWGASRANYAAQLVAERLTGTVQETFTTSAMQWGIATEPEARAVYEFFRDAKVERVGFVNHPRIAMSGASPDGRVGDAGLVEIKCPLTATHIETLLAGSVPGKYVLQMQWQMACDGRQWCDFVSYDPRMPEDMRLFVRRVSRDDAKIAEIEAEVVAFLADVDATLARLTDLYRSPLPAAAE
jgi:putative phage-type endonuclease